VGQEPRIGAVRNISALPPRADVGAESSDRRFVPISSREQCSKIALLLDHLVGADQERFRNRQPETFRRLEIDYEFERRRLLHRYVLGTLTAK